MPSTEPANQPRIRPATPDDVPRLVALEVRAGQLFRTVGLVQVAEHEPDPAELLDAVTDARAWVIVEGSGDGVSSGAALCGYVVTEVLDAQAHIAQVSVDPDHARRGLGRALVEHAEAWGRAAGRPATTLTTFRDVAWNAPYYRRLGYRVLTEAELGPELASTMAREATLPGMRASARCAMVKPNH